ncbi:hypothetical protein [uncultured Winogradskyella sp.]|uniref:hypothetical protein n=1 Tax=uncultured Winogradskyella sp. TaxID=395353 RepID=UPI002631F7E5|nr:hypothetical protein [uncultured Winogradskyella sp.]
MSVVDFIKNKTGSSYLALATRQQKQLSYLTESKVQEEINVTYLEQFAQRNYISQDYFLNWVKAIFKTDNFLTFFKYFRHPLSSARLINDKIKPQLERVFHAEDSYFKYIIRGQEVERPEELEVEKFQDIIFNALLFNYNDIIVHDLKEVNTPYREIVSIENVVAIKSFRSEIHQIAYSASVIIEDKETFGYLYMDKERYMFFNNSFEPLLDVEHDLNRCPAEYISKDPFSSENDIVRKCIFSYNIESLEEYVFLKTLQRMTEPNGAIPIVTQLNTSVKNKNKAKSGDNTPMSANTISSQKPELTSEVIGKTNDSPLQAGSRVKVPMIKKQDGSLDMDAVKNFLNFFYVPVDILEFINKRISEVEKNIIVSILGDYSEASESAKNEIQVQKSYENKQDKLRAFASNLTRIRNRSDWSLLALKYSPESITVDCFQGSDFFIESQEDIYNLLGKSPNAIERKNLLQRLSRNRNKFNPNKAKRESIMYTLMPYSTDKDFDKALTRSTVNDIVFEYQTRFTYWIDKFESTYGDLVFFWDLIEGTDSEKTVLINNLITTIIKEDYGKNSKEANSTLESVQE